MEIYGNFLEDSEAANLKEEFQKLLPKLHHLYRSNQYEVFIKKYFSITDEYKTMSSVMTEEGMNDYMLNLLIQGTKSIDNDLPNGAAYMLLGILGRASRIDNKVARHVVALIKKELVEIDQHHEAINVNR